MLQQTESQVISELKKGNICTVNSYSKRLRVKPMEILPIFINIYKGDRNQNFELLCHIAIINEQDVRIQMERYSNIQKGVIIENNNSHNTYLFKKQDIRQLKILAIFPKNLLISQVESMLQLQIPIKTKEYANRFVVLPKLIMENSAMFKNKSKKQEKKEQKIAEVKKEKHEPQPKKNLKKTQSKSSIQTQKKMVTQAQQKKSIPLQKVSSKEQSSKPPTPVLTNYMAERQKVSLEIEVNVGKKSKKLLLESDEEYYDPRAKNQHFITQSDKNIETDNSGKKEQKMDIESQHIKDKNLAKFIADDQDDQEDNLFAKMEEVAKKKETQSQNRSQSLTRHKKQSVDVPPQKLKPQVIKPNPIQQSQSTKIPNAPLGNKNMLMNWLKPKKVDQ